MPVISAMIPRRAIYRGAPRLRPQPLAAYRLRGDAFVPQPLVVDGAPNLSGTQAAALCKPLDGLAVIAVCAMYLAEFIQNYHMGERLKALDLNARPDGTAKTP